MKIEKIKVKCEWCEKLLGFRNRNTYDVKNGTIQQGQGKGELLLSFCSKRCQRKYNFLLDKLSKIERRLKDLETGHFERKIEILNQQGDLHPEFKKYLK